MKLFTKLYKNNNIAKSRSNNILRYSFAAASLFSSNVFASFNVNQNDQVGGVASSDIDTAMRTVDEILKAPKFTEGAGFEVYRPVGARIAKERSDPFLMLDELGPKDYRKNEFEGAPWHPHRGFDTVMYLKQGEGSHQDSSGNKGTLRAGDVQWMTAASGLQHDEGRDHPGGTLHGFQMWVNLPQANKMDPPSYHDISAKSIATFKGNGITAKVIAGEVGGKKAIIQPKAEVQYVDFMCEPGADYKHFIPKSMTTVMAYVYKGGGVFGKSQKHVGEKKENKLIIF